MGETEIAALWFLIKAEAKIAYRKRDVNRTKKIEDIESDDVDLQVHATYNSCPHCICTSKTIMRSGEHVTGSYFLLPVAPPERG